MKNNKSSRDKTFLVYEKKIVFYLRDSRIFYSLRVNS